MPLKTARSTSSIETESGTGTGTGMGVGKGSSNGIQMDKQSEVMQALDADSDTVSSRGTVKSTYTGPYMGMSADSVTGVDSSNQKEAAASLPKQGSAFTSMPEYGVYDIMIEGDEEIKDTYRNMMAVLPPSSV